HAVGQVEQMHASTCYVKSSEKNKLGCISCHDAHRLPESEEKLSYYRAQCQKCHAQGGKKDCNVPEAKRQKENGNSCYVCHMPRYGATDIVHTSMSDHRVPRRPLNASQPKVNMADPIALFHKSPSAPTGPELMRDTGIALTQISQKFKQRR